MRGDTGESSQVCFSTSDQAMHNYQNWSVPVFSYLKRKKSDEKRDLFILIGKVSQDRGTPSVSFIDGKVYFPP